MTYDPVRYMQWFRAKYHGDAAWRKEHLGKALEWRHQNADRNRQYQREYKRKYRAAKKLEMEAVNETGK